ncbi:ligand-binding sensor domain-containing protein [Niabella drilacis]|uniref:Sensor histidine kinase, LytS/YehU family n=1 Tax=Niabella drilacis (strain DSM 25811 / CCM 8410 / CCUG 62505 / LMG 26954 / E90) TaxID=1285928 RepID=A0A1G6SGT8_NIADE|nr:sensor histidine kinase [Niabella drilacis]SDD15864.1 Sensor histidine kinase, LytS/YehU family [Niabella drilacis]
MKKSVVIFLLFLYVRLFAQPPVMFHQVTTAEGLNDGWIHAICQDKYGYMWFASAGALNRYNGKTIKRFTYDRTDSTSPPASLCEAIACGPDGRLWFSFWNETAEFDYGSFAFRRIKKAEGLKVNTIVPVAANRLYLVARSGLRCYNPAADRFEELSTDAASRQLLKTTKANSAFLKEDELYIGGDGCYVVYNIRSGKAVYHEVKELRGKAVNKIMVAAAGDLWLANHADFRLLRVDGHTHKTEVLDHLLVKDQHDTPSLVNGFAEDENNTIWMVTNLNALLCYDPPKKKLVHYRYSPDAKNALLSNMLFSIWKGKDKRVWLGSDVGVNYVDQQKNIFRIGYPFGSAGAHAVTRGIEEDHEGNLWFTTGNGISRYNVQTGKYTVWRNRRGMPDAIYFNSVRAVVEDVNHDIWVATGAGVNRLNRANDRMDFLTIKDSIPQSFYFSAGKTSDGTVWFGERDYDGLYYYLPAEKKFHSIAHHPVLKRYKGYTVRFVFEDSKKRIWFGYNGDGLSVYNPLTGATRRWQSTDKTANTVIGDVVISINEDKDGKIWVATFSGVSCIDADKNEFTSYTVKDGLPGNIVGSIAVDDSNRVWLGTAGGLVMLGKSRRYFTPIGAGAGLQITDFVEHPAFKLRSGEFIMPSRRGYVQFDPLRYKEDSSVTNCFIADIGISGNRHIPMGAINGGGIISLKQEENFFTVELEAVSFGAQLWYAYKLDGLEKDWHYTQDPKAVYSSVPGGSYTFRYKASSNINNWRGGEKQLRLQVATIFYKKAWFRILAVLLMVAAVFLVYRFRMNKQRQILNLETKTASLEKEKTLVQYESLKQHLNPHFLFNSLTALRSLIKSDAKTATSFLDGMSRVYRYVLKSDEQELVYLRDELGFVKTFVELQKTRFREGLDVVMDVPERFFNNYIVPVTLQNLVENAIKHNTADKESPLQIRIFAADDCVIVSNNLQRYRIVETSNKKGLANMQTLYRYYSDRPLVIIEEGHYFIVKIPLL